MEQKQIKNKFSKNLRMAVVIVGIVLGIALLSAYIYWPRDDMEADSQPNTDSAVTDSAQKQSDFLENTWDADYDRDIYEVTGQRIEKKNIDWDELHAENADIYAWITVPNTEVDYPVLQDPDDDSYYLMHNIDGSSGYPGCIYSEATYNTTDFTDRMTVIYGHNMKNNSMFASLHRFEDASFFKENRYIYVYLPTGHTLVYEIWAEVAHSNEHILYSHDFSNDEMFMSFINTIAGEAQTDGLLKEEAATRIDADSYILALSTCISHNEKKRLLIMGNLQNPQYLDA